MDSRLKYEVDRLSGFEKPVVEDFSPLWRRSVLAQLEIVHVELFGVSMGKHTRTIRFTKKFSGSHTPIDVIIAGRLFELYQRQALLLLRTGGFLSFMDFIYRTQQKFERYPEETPFAVLGRKTCLSEIVFSNSDEISERLRNFFKNPKALSYKDIKRFLVFDESFNRYLPKEIQKESASFKENDFVKMARDVSPSRE